MPPNIFAIIFFALSLLVITSAFFTWGWMIKIALIDQQTPRHLLVIQSE